MFAHRFWLVAFRVFVVASLLGCAGYQPAPIVGGAGGVVLIPPPPGYDDIVRCEATGKSHEQCCEDHQMNPCP